MNNTRTPQKYKWSTLFDLNIGEFIETGRYHIHKEYMLQRQTLDTVLEITLFTKGILSSINIDG